jgi:hypothetical protein
MLKMWVYLSSSERLMRKKMKKKTMACGRMMPSLAHVDLACEKRYPSREPVESFEFGNLLASVARTPGSKE